MVDLDIDGVDHLAAFRLGRPQHDIVRLPFVLGVHPRCAPQHTSMLSMSTSTAGAAAGGALAGAATYLMCKSKCPGGSKSGMFGQAFKEIGGAAKGMFGAVKGLFSSNDEEEKPYGMGDNGEMKSDKELIQGIHKRTCECNCKMDALLMAAAGAAAGHMAGKMAAKKGMVGQTIQVGGPLDEWTAGTFFAALMKEDGGDYLGLSPPAGGPSSIHGAVTGAGGRKVERVEPCQGGSVHDPFREFLCLAHEDLEAPTVQCRVMRQTQALPNPQEGSGTEEACRHAAVWRSFFEAEKLRNTPEKA